LAAGDCLDQLLRLCRVIAVVLAVFTELRLVLRVEPEAIVAGGDNRVPAPRLGEAGCLELRRVVEGVDEQVPVVSIESASRRRSSRASGFSCIQPKRIWSGVACSGWRR
jgi:hypothetical protein